MKVVIPTDRRPLPEELEAENRALRTALAESRAREERLRERADAAESRAGDLRIALTEDEKALERGRATVAEIIARGVKEKHDLGEYFSGIRDALVRCLDVGDVAMRAIDGYDLQRDEWWEASDAGHAALAPAPASREGETSETEPTCMKRDERPRASQDGHVARVTSTPAGGSEVAGTILTCDVCGEEFDPMFGRCRNAFHEQNAARGRDPSGGEDEKTKPCDHEGIGRPGCTTCDPLADKHRAAGWIPSNRPAPAQAPDDAEPMAETDLQAWSDFLTHCGSPEDFRTVIRARDISTHNAAVEASAELVERYEDCSAKFVAGHIRALKKPGGPAR